MRERNSGWVVAWTVGLMACGGGASHETTTVARDPVPDEPFTAPPSQEQAATTQIQEEAARTPPAPCEAACSTLVHCQEGGFADEAGCRAACEPSVTEPLWTCRMRVNTCGETRMCTPPAPVRGHRFSARSLTGPIDVALEYRRTGAPGGGESIEYTLVARLTDAQKATRDLAVARVQMPDAGAVMSIEPAEAGDASAPLFTDQRFFAGAGDNFRAVHTGDTVVIEHQETDEQSGEGHWRPAVRIDLPRGAEVRAGTLPL